MVSMASLLELKDLIIAELNMEFEEKHLTGNLVDTIYCEYTEDGIRIVIPAEVYNFYQWFVHGIKVPSNRTTGSYASELDKRGSKFPVYDKKGRRYFVKPGNHKDFVNKCINNALEKWQNKNASNYKVLSKREG